MEVQRLIRLPEIQHLTGYKTTKVYADILEGTFLPPVKMSRTSVWPEKEVATIINARIAGKSDDELRKLVKELVAARTKPTTTISAQQPPAALPATSPASRPRRKK